MRPSKLVSRLATGDHILVPIRAVREALLSHSDDTEDPWFSDRWNEVSKHLQIVTKTEGRKPLVYNDAQEELRDLIINLRKEKSLTRLVILKYRRKGISTFIQALFFLDVLLRSNRYNYMASFEDESTRIIFRMSHTFWDHLPKRYKEGLYLKARRKTEMIFGPPHNSSFLAATANRQYLASGQLIHCLHLSEPAKYKDPPAHDAITSVLQCVPRHWDTAIIWESTAAGVGLFKDWWDDACSKDPGTWNGYVPVFKTWIGDPECRVPVPKGAKNIFSQEERRFQKEAKITDEELYWAKLVRREQCHNDWGEFHQEYPWCPEVAFRVGGERWFDSNGLAALQKEIEAPSFRGSIEWMDESRPLVRVVQNRIGILEIWKHPDQDSEYVISADIAEGCGANYTVINVLSVPKREGEPIEQVAKIRSNKIDAAQAGEFIFMLGAYYNWAFACPEVNNQGLLTCTVLRDGLRCPQMSGGYPAMYYHIIAGRKDEPETRKLGWLTSPQTKHLMLGDLKQAISSGDLIIRSATTYRELEGFSHDPTKNDWFQQYRNPETGLRHTDEVIAIAIGLQGIKHRRESGAQGRRLEE